MLAAAALPERAKRLVVFTIAVAIETVFFARVLAPVATASGSHRS
jgi:hypothetical protein